MSTTTRAEFETRIAAGDRVVPVLREVFADGETPIGVYRKLAQGTPGAFLLESAEQGGIWSRWSFIGVRAFGVLTEEHGAARWLDRGLSAERALGPDAPTAPLARTRSRSTCHRSPCGQGRRTASPRSR